MWIDVSRPFPFVAGAALLAKLAYPDQTESILYAKFRWALCRWRVLDRVHKEPQLAGIPQPIIPAAFTAPHGEYLSTMKKGQRKLFQRMIATNWIIIPHLEAIRTGKVEDVEGRYPSINWLSELAVEHLGWKGKKASVSTFKSKVWAKTRSVSHAMTAYLYFNRALV